MIPLETIGFDVLSEKDKKDFQKLFSEYSRKIQRRLKNIEKIRIHLKEHNYKNEIKDKNKKFSIHALVIYSGKTIEADAFDWDFKRALHKVFRKIEEATEHAFHISNQHKNQKSTKFK
jgi:hypothetical protein